MFSYQFIKNQIQILVGVFNLRGIHPGIVGYCLNISRFAVAQKAGGQHAAAKGGEKNFDGTVTELQMQTYLIVRDFRKRLNKKGFEYGWPISVYTTPEALWGYDHVTSAYSTAPAESGKLILDQLRRNFPKAEETKITI